MTTTEQTKPTYGHWHIEYAPPPIPTHQFDYSFWHDGFDGPEDNRCGHAESVIDAMTQINEREADAFDCSCTAAVPGECMALTCALRDDANARYEAYRAEADKFAVAVPA